LEVLLELHNEAELGHICEGVSVVGINNRDLGSFVTDTAISERLAGLLPQGIVRISESGISSPQTVRDLRGKGFRGFLMGENFMKRPDPAAALAEFIKELSPSRDASPKACGFDGRRSVDETLQSC
jgi:indole-3-glycerol phosphate synthase